MNSTDATDTDTTVNKAKPTNAKPVKSIKYLFNYSAPVLFFLALFAIAHYPRTTEELTIQAPQCACEGKAETYEDSLRFNFGVFKGQCIDSCRFRKAVVLQPSSAKAYGADGDHEVVANILHNGKYWIAKVPIKRTTEVDIAFENFLSGISHVVLRFHFSRKNPVKLYQEDDPTVTQSIQDLVLSAEGVPPRDHKYSFFESSVGQYLLVYRFLSIEDTIRWMVDIKRHSVKQFRLNLDSAAREKLLVAGFEKSMGKSFHTIYKVLSNNCATSAMELLGTNSNGWMNPLSLQEAIPLDAPFGTVNVLEKLGLIDSESQLPNLENESRRAAYKSSKNGLLRKPSSRL
jgi:hypothetical protein